MSVLLTILVVIIIFSVLVLIHEAGHFIAARRAGIKVLEFGIGFPPRIWSRKKGETIYSVNAVPFGGFVKLYGEDADSAEALKGKRSFAGAPLWVRAKVVCAGVFMNFVLAIVLLTVGFIFGIEPLLVTEQDLFEHIATGDVLHAPGAYVAKVSGVAEKSGIAAGDRILAVDDKPVDDASDVSIFQKGRAEKDIDITIQSAVGGQKKIHLPVTKEKHFGIDLKPHTEFPRLEVIEVKPNTRSERAGLQAGDIILQMNREEIYFPADFESVLAESASVNFKIFRGSGILEIPVNLPDTKKVVIADVFPLSAAESAGFQKGDIIVAIDGRLVVKPEEVQEMLRKNPGKEMKYQLMRHGDQKEIKAKTGENNLLGIALSEIASFRNTEISVFRGSVFTSITEIKKVSYAPWKAFKQAVFESVRLTGLTAKAFGRTISQIVSRFSVPSEIGGPVQIAYYTHTFIQEGFFALLRFTALLSLSLAVINVLPIPALDGGRLLFIVIEAVTGRRVNARLESLVHSIGFVLLMILIVLVTYSDITKLF